MQEGYVDIHCHLLPGVDDGSPSMEVTREMMRMAYCDGIRSIIFTPHVRRPWLDITNDEIQLVYEQIEEQAKQIADDLVLYLGSEIYYSHELMEEYVHKIRPIQGTAYVLVEFSPDISFSEMIQAFTDVRNLGYEIILAHIERYGCLRENIGNVEHLYDMGVLLQVNASTITKPKDREHKKFMKHVLKEELIHFIATDAHGVEHRRPEMKDAVRLVAKKYGETYAQALSSGNAQRVLQGEILL